MKLTKLIVTAICAALLSACSGSNDSYYYTYTPAVTAKGGSGTNGAGGTGGTVYVDSYGAIKVLNSGSADTSFTMPASSSYNFGPTPYTVSGSESIILNTTAPEGYKGLMVKLNDWQLYKVDAEGVESIVTGLRVPAGAVLTVNADNGHYSGTLGAYLEFTYDIVIEGTLKTGTGFNYIYFVNAYNNVLAKQLFEGHSLNDNNIVVTGTVTTSGENNGSIEFDAGKHFYNSGTLDASGGYNGSGSGYSSDGIYIHAYTGSVYSKGIMKANGGNGGNGNGGSAYYIDLEGGYNEDSTVDPLTGGSVVISGLYQANGGNAGGTTGGSGGGGGYMEFYANGGDTLVYGRFETIGGNGFGTLSSPGKVSALISGFNGGSPDGIDFYCYGEDYRNVGVCQVSGSFDLSGGTGENGGNAGYLSVDSIENSTGVAPDVQLLGFGDIFLDGGNGTIAGGNASGDAYELYSYAPYDNNSGEYLPAYPIVSKANVWARGGNATAAGAVPVTKAAAAIAIVRGGTGGYIDIETDFDGNSISTISTVTQSGTINNSGGNATNTNGVGGNASELYMYGYQVTTTGEITSKGGNGAAIGGTGGNISLSSSGYPESPTIYTPANLSVKGGTGATPGNVGNIYVDSE